MFKTIKCLNVSFSRLRQVVLNPGKLLNTSKGGLIVLSLLYQKTCIDKLYDLNTIHTQVVQALPQTGKTNAHVPRPLPQTSKTLNSGMDSPSRTCSLSKGRQYHSTGPSLYRKKKKTNIHAPRYIV